MGPRFFLPLLIRLAVVAAGPLAVGWWFLGPIGGAVAALAILGLELWRIDRAVRTGAEDRVSFKSTPPADLTWLDETAIRDALRELRTVGFFPIADCTYSVPVYSPGFVRLLAQSPQRIYACVAQGRRGTHNPEPVAVTLFSVLADGRTLTTTSAQPHATMALGLEAVDSWQIRPGRNAHELMTEHLATRAELCAPSDTLVAGDGTLDTFIAMQRALYHRQAQECRMNGALAALRRGLRWERASTKSWIEGQFTTAAPLVAPPLVPTADPPVVADRAPAAPVSAPARPPAPEPPVAAAPRPPQPTVVVAPPPEPPAPPPPSASPPPPAPAPPIPPRPTTTIAPTAASPLAAVQPVPALPAPVAVAAAPYPAATASRPVAPVTPTVDSAPGPVPTAPAASPRTRPSPQPRRRQAPPIIRPDVAAPVAPRTPPQPAPLTPSSTPEPLAAATEPAAPPRRRMPSARRTRTPAAVGEPTDGIATPGS